MKRIIPLIALGIGIACPSMARAQVLLTYWNFNNDSPAYNSGVSPAQYGSFNTAAAAYGEAYDATNRRLSSNAGNSAIFSGSNVYLDFNPLIAGIAVNQRIINGIDGVTSARATSTTGSGGYGVFLDSTLNRLSGDSTTGGSLQFVNSGNRLNGKNITLSLASTGYEDLAISYATRWSNSTSGTQTWSYSLDGANFFSLPGGTRSMARGASTTNFTAFSLNLSSVAAIEDVSTFYLRMTFASSSMASFSMDNFQLTGTSIVPEPSTAALLLLSGIGLFLGAPRVLRRRL